MTTSDELRIGIVRLARRIRLERASTEISTGRLAVLFVLHNVGPQTLGSLSEIERVTPPSMNRTVNSLVDDGLAFRTPDPDDGRKFLIEITDPGREIVVETRRRRAMWFSQQLERLSPSDRALLDDALPVINKLADS